MGIFKRKKQEAIEVEEEVLPPEPEQESVYDYMIEVAEYLEHQGRTNSRITELNMIQQRLDDLRNEQ